MGEHDGHRKRLRSRFITGKREGGDDLALLELLLCYALPRRDVQPLARELLRNAGGLGGLLSLPLEELTAFSGVGEMTALLLVLAGEASRRSEEQRQKDAVLNSPERVKEYISSRLLFAGEGAVYAIDLDMDLRPLGCQMLTGSESDRAEQILRMALSEGGRTVVTAAGTGEPFPVLSDGDLALVDRMHETLRGLGITLLDHVVIHDEFYASAAQLGELADGEPVRARYHAPYGGLFRNIRTYRVDNIFDDWPPSAPPETEPRRKKK